MKVLRSKVFLICFSLFLLHQILTKGFNIHLGWADNYLDSFLAMPVILTLWLAERRILFKKGSAYLLSPMHVAIATLYVVVVAEVLFPYLSPQFTTDWLDVIGYIAGSILFYFTINQTR